MISQFRQPCAQRPPKNPGISSKKMGVLAECHGEVTDKALFSIICRVFRQTRLTPLRENLLYFFSVVANNKGECLCILLPAG